ncbi:MAG: AAA family ATPase [Proteobacteria bacterium]|nr:AAA family ATPase [Pseudomonadota bacterium]
MPYLQRLHVHEHYKLPDFSIDLDSSDGQSVVHLILTGPNGAGKTTIVERLAFEVAAQQEPDEAVMGGRERGFRVLTDWTAGDVAAEYRAGSFVAAYLAAGRLLDSSQPSGPTNLQLRNEIATRGVAVAFLQYLVNQQVQARLAQHDAPEEAQRILAWFDEFEAGFAELMGIAGLKHEFLRKTFDMQFREPGGVAYNFQQLAAGASSILRILAELILRTDAAGVPRDSDELSGVVIIDEPDGHLHPALQERILPFLTRLFPNLQFVVATHSPAIICSVENAVVVDLTRPDRPISSAELRGTPYGQLMTSHFGIETDIDLASTEQLRRLQVLRDKKTLDEAERSELEGLARSLQKTSHILALEVWNQLLSEQIDNSDDAEVTE